MNRITRILVYSVIIAPLSILADDKPKIPIEVKYKFMDDRQESIVRASLIECFRQGESSILGMFRKECTCAPGYWNIFSKDSELKNTSAMDFSVANGKTGITYKFKGAVLRDALDLQVFARYFASHIGSSPVIRRLTRDEVCKFWMVIPFDIEEPVYILESNSVSYVVCFREDQVTSKFNIWWIDVLSGYDFVDKLSFEDKP